MNSLVRATQMGSELRLDVPHSSQRIDLSKWGYRHRACGMVSAYMALMYYEGKGYTKLPIPPLESLVELGEAEGGLLSEHGWKHDYLVDTFRRFGISCRRDERMDTVESIKLFQHCIVDCGDPVLVSTQHVRFGPTDRITHIIVLTGVRLNEDDSVAGFFFHDPNVYARGEGIHEYVPVDMFHIGWRRMAILPCTKM